MHSIGADDPVPIMCTLRFVNDTRTGTKNDLASVPRYMALSPKTCKNAGCRMRERIRLSMRTSFVCQENKSRVIYTRYYVENFKVFAVLSHNIQRIGRSAEQGK